MIWFLAALLSVGLYLIPGAPSFLILFAIGFLIMGVLRAVEVRHE